MQLQVIVIKMVTEKGQDHEEDPILNQIKQQHPTSIQESFRLAIKLLPLFLMIHSRIVKQKLEIACQLLQMFKLTLRMQPPWDGTEKYHMSTVATIQDSRHKAGFNTRHKKRTLCRRQKMKTEAALRIIGTG